jgi:hypothetical protein
MHVKTMSPLAAVGALALLVLAPALPSPAWAAPAPRAPGHPPPAAPAQPASPSEASGKQPKLVIDKDTVDVGDVVRGSMGVATFELKNTGDADLRILDARPG